MYFVLTTPPRLLTPPPPNPSPIRPFTATGLVKPRYVIYNLDVKNRDISAVCIKRKKPANRPAPQRLFLLFQSNSFFEGWGV